MISKRNIKKISLVLLILLFVAIFFLLNLNFIFSEFFTSNLSSVASNQIPKKYANEILENSKLNQSLINENEELRKMLKLEKESKFNLIHAQVTVKTPIVLSAMGFVNKGKENGVREGYLVINHTGLIGKIGKVFNRHSEIIFPHSPRFSTLVLVGENKISGIFKGDGVSSYIEYIPVQSDINVDDKIYLSDNSGFAYTSFQIGSVESIEVKKGFLRIKVKGLVYSRGAKFVSIVKNEKL
tara:strand:+ start:102 stop:821 length:720 start_codon:yes stop_codon:yes gene_type:complete